MNKYERDSGGMAVASSIGGTEPRPEEKYFCSERERERERRGRINLNGGTENTPSYARCNMRKQLIDLGSQAQEMQRQIPEECLRVCLEVEEIFPPFPALRGA